MGMEYFYVCLVLLLSAFFVNGMVPQDPMYEHTKRGTYSLAEPDPPSGRQRLLVVTVDYPSQKGKYTATQWQNDYFTTWKQYHQAQSYNTLQYDIDVVTINDAGNPVINDPIAKSYITLQNPVSSYANNAYGWDFKSKWNLHTIVREAAAFLDSKNFSWTPYIQNGMVKNMLIMSAGHDYRYAQNVVPDAASNYLLSTSYQGVKYNTKSGASLNSYTFCSEHTQSVGSSPLFIARPGQCLHEHGHALGIPDLYDVSYQSSGVGFFDMLGYGVYAGDTEGATPVGYGAYTKDLVGWSKPTVITTEQQVTLAASSLAPENFLKIIPTSREPGFFYLVENRQVVDKWDTNFFKVYGNGILIWRVNETDVRLFTSRNYVNTLPQSGSISVESCPSTPAVVLMEADGKQDMSSPQRVINYGSSKDVWQLGGQFNGPNSVSIAIIGLRQNVYTLHISFSGPIDIPSALLDPTSSSFLLSASPLLLLLTFALTSLLL